MKTPFPLLMLMMALLMFFSGQAFCFLAAGKTYQIDPLLLIAIAEVESSMNPKTIGLNKKNGVVKTEDIGLMQINSSWLPQLSHSFGITRKHCSTTPAKICMSVPIFSLKTSPVMALTGRLWRL